MTPIIIVPTATSTALAPSLWFLIMILLAFVFMYLVTNGVNFNKATTVYALVGVIMIPICIAIENKVNAKVEESEQKEEPVKAESASFMRKMDEQNNQQRLANVNIIGGKSD